MTPWDDQAVEDHEAHWSEEEPSPVIAWIAIAFLGGAFVAAAVVGVMVS